MMRQLECDPRIIGCRYCLYHHSYVASNDVHPLAQIEKEAVDLFGGRTNQFRTRLAEIIKFSLLKST